MIKYFLFLLLLTPILSYADNTNQPLPKEIIGNQKLPEEDLIPYGQEKQRLKYKYNIVTGLPSGLSKFALFSLGYNINGYFSVGISQNQNRQTSEDYSYYDGTKTLSKGVYTEAGSVPSQDYGNTQLIPKMGTNIFLHYYPLIKLDLPIYIPVYLGRSQGSTLINGSENGIFNPAYQMDKPSYPLPILHMSVDAKPALYYGIGLGLKYILPSGVIAGVEFGMVNLYQIQYNYNIQVSLLNKNSLSLSDFLFLQEQLKNAIQPSEKVKLNYGIILGVSF